MLVKVSITLQNCPADYCNDWYSQC